MVVIRIRKREAATNEPNISSIIKKVNHQNSYIKDFYRPINLKFFFLKMIVS